MKKPRPLVIHKREWARVNYGKVDGEQFCYVRLAEMPMFLSDKQTEKFGAWLVKADRWIKTKKGNIR